jgi:polar amino acid transport system substrate-binding protein
VSRLKNDFCSFSLAAKILLLVILLSLGVFTPVMAQKPGSTLRVATRVIAPFVTQDQQQLSGFSIDLWRSIAEQMNVTSQFQVTPTVTDLLAAVKANKADVGIAAVSITAERDRDFDFSQPIYESGLQIMVRADSSHRSSILAALKDFFSPAIMQLLGIIVLIVLIPANILWFVERHHPSSIVGSKSYFPGIFHATWWAAATLATQAEEMPKSNLGRVLAVFWMFVSVVFVAYFTASVTSSLTVQQLSSNIKGPDDLPGKRVATIQGSTTDKYLRDQHAQVTDYADLEGACEALQRGDVDAVVYDSPVLLYYAAHEGKGQVQVVGSLFRKEDYGIVVPPNSPLRKPIDAALLALKENGTYEQIYDHWFAASDN